MKKILIGSLISGVTSIITVYVLLSIFGWSTTLTNPSEQKINNSKGEVDNFTGTTIKWKDGYVTVIISNKRNEKFAYAKMTKFQGEDLMYSQIRFSNTSCDTIEIPERYNLALFEFIEDKDGKSMLKKKQTITDVANYFKIE